jgi:hypothetical protein
MLGTKVEKRKDLILLLSFSFSMVINPSQVPESFVQEAGSEEDAESKHEYADVDADVC